MISSKFRAILFTIIWGLSLQSTQSMQSIHAQTNSPTKLSDAAPVFTDLVNQVVDIQLNDGSLLGNVTVAEVGAGKIDNSIRTLKIQSPNAKRPINLNANKIAEVIAHNSPLDVEYQKKERCLVHSPEKRSNRLKHREEVQSRLSTNRDRYWEPLNDEAQEKFMARHRDFLEKTKKKMPDVPFRLIETEYFLFLTDLSSHEVDAYIAYLDAMYQELCKAFGLSPDKNIWAGKCVVVAFREAADYYRFETTVMENRNSAGTQGLCHQSTSGTVIFAGYRGDNGFFGHVLVHETSHGFVHRYLTTARAPSWLNEGMADWLANSIVKGDSISQRQKQSAKMVMQNGGWGDFLTVDQIPGEHYGTASTLVEILLARDKGGQFRQFFNSIKEGKPADESLKDSFGISYQDLQILYAQRAVGLK